MMVPVTVHGRNSETSGQGSLQKPDRVVNATVVLNLDTPTSDGVSSFRSGT